MSSQSLQSFLAGLISVVLGDITCQNVTAIVNAANWTLLGGGGVDGAIHDAGGPDILKECQEIRRTVYPKGLPTGQAYDDSKSCWQKNIWEVDCSTWFIYFRYGQGIRIQIGMVLKKI